MNNLSNSFTDNELRGMITGNNPVSNAYRELLAYREAQGKPIAHIFQHPAGKLFWAISDDSNAGTNGVIPVFAAPQLPVVPQTLLRELVDVVWQDAKESTEVPATSHADELILQVFGNSEQVNSPVIPDGWTENDSANSALVMLDRIDTLDSADDVRIEEIKRIIRHLATIPKPEVKSE